MSFTLHVHVHAHVQSHACVQCTCTYMLAEELYDDIAGVHVGEYVLRGIWLREKGGAKHNRHITIGHLKEGERENTDMMQ